ncbi:MAG: hypothetical protein MJZ32_11470 [Bacteroidaceae bacterium]|nr:hypothetical protein [Bacteroidaceae bacterium]
MDISHPSFWSILLLSIPTLIGLAIFGYLLWSDSRYYKGKDKSVNKQ